MQIKIDDWIVHPQHGVGRVVKLETRDFGSGTEQRYYEIAIPTGTIWVPVEEKGNRLRKITVKRELAKYRKVLRTRPAPLVGDHRQRQAALLERLKKGSFKSRCELLRDLSAHSKLKPLNESSGALLKRMQQMVCDEWAMAAELSHSEASQEIEDLLQRGRETYESKV